MPRYVPEHLCDFGTNKIMRRTYPTIYERLPRDVFNLQSILSKIISTHIWNPDFPNEIRHTIQKHTNIDTNILLTSIRTTSTKTLPSILPPITFIAIIEIEPSPVKILLEIDRECIFTVINRLLGIRLMTMHIHRSLTDIEQGVFSFLLLKLLSKFTKDIAFPKRTMLRLVDMRSSFKDCLDIFHTNDHWVVANWHIDLDSTEGHARLIAPLSLSQQSWIKNPSSSSLRKKHYLSFIQNRKNRLKTVVFTARLTAGLIEFSRRQWKALEPEDIIILDETNLHLDDTKSLSGSAELIFNLRAQRSISGSVLFSPSQRSFRVKQLQCSITHQTSTQRRNTMKTSKPHTPIKRTDHSQTNPPPRSEQTSSTNPQHDKATEDKVVMETHEILSNLPVNITIELARIELSVDDILHLHPGQLLDLGIETDHTIALTTGAQELARCELVEIDDHLGLRVLSIVPDELP